MQATELSGGDEADPLHRPQDLPVNWVQARPDRVQIPSIQAHDQTSCVTNGTESVVPAIAR